MQTKQSILRTESAKLNDNISFPIGTILAVKKYYKRLGLTDIFGKFKNRGHNINSLDDSRQNSPVLTKLSNRFS